MHLFRIISKNLFLLLFVILFTEPAQTAEIKNNCTSRELHNDDEKLDTRIGTMDAADDFKNLKVETSWDKSGNEVVRARVVFNSKPDSYYDAVFSTAISSDGKRYAYTAKNKDKIFPVIDGKPMLMSLKVDENCCDKGGGGHWFEVWQYTNYLFGDDGKSFAFLEIDSRRPPERLILNGKEVARGQFEGQVKVSSNGTRIGYFTNADKKLHFYVDHKRYWSFDNTSSPYKKVKITSLTEREAVVIGIENERLIELNCKLDIHK